MLSSVCVFSRDAWHVVTVGCSLRHINSNVGVWLLGQKGWLG